jgi:dihydropteroate synthase
MKKTKIKIMGVLNVTPDSFSDGGRFSTLEKALEQVDSLVEAGVDIIDIGGESTRPFSDPVSTKEEMQRVIPVISAIRENHTVPISIDTTKALVAEAALGSGADIINDVSALRKDPNMIVLVRKTDVPIIIMHMKGSPSDMQVKPEYENVVEEILEFFRERIEKITACGIRKNRLIIDPGIGFGKTLRHNLTILNELHRFSELGLPVLLGHSRKRFLGDITGIDVEENRDTATAAVSALCAGKNIDIIRVHNVAATRAALLVAEALAAAEI